MSRPEARGSRRGLAVAALALLAAAVVPGAGRADLAPGNGQGMTDTAHREDVLAWREWRHGRLSNPTGWLTLVGLDWLDEGANRVGSGADNDVRLPGGPGYWGTVTLDGNRITFERADDPAVTVDGERPDTAELVADDAGEPTEVSAGTLTFYVIHRESYALRVKDTQAPTLLAFDGMAYYDIDPSWRIDGRLLPPAEGQTVEVGNVLGQIVDQTVHGIFEFERGGEMHRMLAFRDGDDEELWFIFGDRTNGRGTYGGGRFVVSEGLPEDGRLVVDFNKAYNPPCVFTEYSTCELPPPENRLDLAVEAGEKDYTKAY